MLKIKIPFIDNSSHGYGKVSYYDLKGFGIDLKNFSSFSFYNSKNACVYLEEDCDLPKFIKLLEDKKIYQQSIKRGETQYKKSLTTTNKNLKLLDDVMLFQKQESELKKWFISIKKN